MPEVQFIDLGLIDYKDAWDYQTRLFDQTIQQKIAFRNGVSSETPKNYLIFCEHPHVYTLGKSGSAENLLLNQSALEEKNATFYTSNRGGDITYHGPGQLVAYPIFDLDQFFPDIHKYMRYLEEAVISTLGEFDIKGDRLDGYTGVWIDPSLPEARKICAMGVKSSRWVTMHGIGFNILSDLSYFSHIVPCGIADKAVTSMQKELEKAVDFEYVKCRLKEHLALQFGYRYV